MARATGMSRRYRTRMGVTVALSIVAGGGSSVHAGEFVMPEADRFGHLGDLLQPRSPTGVAVDGMNFASGRIAHKGQHRLVGGGFENTGTQMQASLGRERLSFTASETHRDGPDKRIGDDRQMALDFNYNLLPSGATGLALIGSHYQRDRGPGRALGAAELEAGQRERRSGLGLRLDLFDRVHAESTFAWGEQTDATVDREPDLRVALRPTSDRTAGLAQQHRVEFDLESASGGRFGFSGDYSWAAPGFRGGMDADRRTVAFGAAFEQGPWALALDSEAYGTNVLGDTERDTDIHTKRTAKLDRQLDGGWFGLQPARIGIGFVEEQSRSDAAGVTSELPVAGLVTPLGAADSVKRTLSLGLNWAQDNGETSLEFRGLDRRTRNDEDGSERWFGEALSLRQRLRLGAWELAGEVAFETNGSADVAHGFGSSGEVAWRPAGGPEMTAGFSLDHQARRDTDAARRTKYAFSGTLGLDPLLRTSEDDRAFLEIVGEFAFEGGAAEDGSAATGTVARALITGGWRF